MTELTFVAWHRPALSPGLYSVRVGQRLTADGLDAALGDITAGGPADAASLRFASHGPRVALPPAAIVARFPAAGAAGHEAGVLPHVVFDDATLPWLRPGGPTSGGRPSGAQPPWLALVVFGGDEIDLLERASRTAADLGLDDEPGQRPDEVATVIRVPATLAAQALPRLADVGWLAHVRETTDPPTVTSVVVGNRAVVPGVRNEVHLVSVEGVDLDASPPPAHVDLVSLAHWSFDAIDDGAGFRDLLLALAHNLGPLHHETGDPLADAFLRRGVLPFRHDEGLSFYRGPLAPSTADPVGQLIAATYDERLPERSADLVVFDEDLAMADVTYAVAYDLGRSLALNDLHVALALDDYRRARRHAGHAQGQLQGLTDHRQPDVELPSTVQTWLDSLTYLDAVPARYLLPDPDRLVPLSEATWTEGGATRVAPGRLAWFSVDPVWTILLGLGALSVGALTERESGHQPPIRPPGMRGFALRSPLVRWDDLEITVWARGLDDVEDATPIDHRVRELGADLRLVLFEWSSGPATVEIGRHPQGVHFGLDEPGDDHGRLDVATLAATLRATDAAAFARQMVQVTPRIRFQLDDEGSS